MRAVVTEDYGSAPTLAELDPPEAGPGEVRVQVLASSLNGFDTALARGYFKGLMDHQFPVVLGKDFAGRVDQVGPGVTEFGAGDNVFGVVMTYPLSAGAFGEYVVVPAPGTIGATPAGLDHATAGVIGLAGAAAVGTFDAVNPQSGQTLFLSGATGGVGAFLLQFAAARGVTVIATATPGAEADHVRGLGATHVVDHHGDVAAQVLTLAPDGVDAVIHCAGDPFAQADLLVPGGRFASLLGIGPEQLAGRPITATAVIANPARALLERLAGDVVARAAPHSGLPHVPPGPGAPGVRRLRRRDPGQVRRPDWMNGGERTGTGRRPVWRVDRRPRRLSSPALGQTGDLAR